MNIWRLISHHHTPAESAEWSRRHGTIAIGFGEIGDLREQSFGTEGDLKRLAVKVRPASTISQNVSGGCSLWRLYSEMKKGDLIIMSDGARRVFTMRVTGDYYFEATDPTHYYEHRRKAEVVPIDPDRLWQFSGGAAAGENIRRTLVRCGRTLTEEELNAFVG